MNILRYVGLKEEATFNPATPPQAGFHIDMASGTLDTPTETQMVYQGGLGRSARTHRPGFYSPAGNIVYAFDIRSIAHLFKWALGGYVFTAGAKNVDNKTVSAETATNDDFFNIGDADVAIAPEVGDTIITTGFTTPANNGAFVVTAILTGQGGTTDETHIFVAEGLTEELAANEITISKKNTHECYGSNNVVLPSFTTRVGKDVFEHTFSGCVVNSLELQIEGEYCMCTADIMAAKDKRDTLKTPTDLLLPEEYPLAFHEVTAKIKGSARSADIKSLTISINNNLSAEAGRGLGSRYPYRLPANAREVTISKNMFFENTDDLARYWGSATGPADLGSEEFDIEVEMDAGKWGDMKLTFPRFIYTQNNLQPSGRDEIVQDTAGMALSDVVTLQDTTTDVRTEVYAEIDNVDSAVSGT